MYTDPGMCSFQMPSEQFCWQTSGARYVHCPELTLSTSILVSGDQALKKRNL